MAKRYTPRYRQPFEPAPNGYPIFAYPHDSALYRVDEVANILNIECSEVLRLIDKGELPYCDINGEIRITRPDLLMFIERSRSGRP